MERFTIEQNGPLHGLDFGGEGKLVLLVHGLGGSSINWAGVGEDLTAHGHVMAIDLPGFGRTPPAGRTAAIDDQAALVAKFIKSHTNEPAIVIGNSMGGIISMLLAARQPHLIDRLILVNPAAPSWEFRTVNTVWAIMMGVYLIPGLNKAAFNALQTRGTPDQRTAESMEMITAHSERVPAWLKKMHADVARERENMPWTGTAFLQAYKSIVRRLIPQARYDRMVHRITAPTLLMHGTRDGIVPYVAAERIANMRPDWTFATLEDTGHVPQLEAAETFVKLVADFVGESERV